MQTPETIGPPFYFIFVTVLRIFTWQRIIINFCTQFWITLTSIRSHCHGQREYLTMQLNFRPGRRKELCTNVCTEHKSGGVCLSACWNTPPPPGPGPGHPPWAWAWIPDGPGPGHLPRPGSGHSLWADPPAPGHWPRHPHWADPHPWAWT